MSYARLFLSCDSSNGNILIRQLLHAVCFYKKNEEDIEYVIKIT